MSRLRGLIAENRGSVAVEFALFLPFFLMLVFGVIELGGAWYQRQMLVNASREGARAASLLNDATNGAAQVNALVRDYLTQSGYPGVVNVTTTGADGNAGTPVSVTVTSDYQFPVLGNLIPGNLAAVTLQAVTVMRHE
ncbi:MAG: TadE/TadG family type IV pilus assembly protein [Thermodesulfobacteriota bacterium]